MFKPEHEELKINLQLFNGGLEDVVEETESVDSEDISIEEPTEPVTEDIPSTEEPEEEYYDEEILYNGKQEKVKKSEVKPLLQKGRNYDKVHTKLSETEQHLKEIEQLTGMSIDQIKTTLKEQTLRQEAQKLMDDDPTLSEETAMRLIRLEQKDKEREELAKKQAFDTAMLQQKAAFKDKPYFKDLEADIDKMIASAPGVDVKTAYNYLRGERLEELLDKAKKDTQKSTIADLHDKAKRGITTSSEGLEEDVDTTSINTDMARAFGNDPKKIAKYVKNQTRR